ncbi:MAG: hypothetical protein IPH74_08670 [Bacteroidetes bacterium]|jgi:predicted RNase H-related nuclease YkuK (DUF458 family)|nr:hypothetical protein [Bacteroidota bacterium]MBP7256087.1 hypothetical protein [Chitinophagales bacterium]MBK7139082.1 hypothetical protein [Bacteroidota bacterium]MBK7506235.1 hypothetical protein [Bacteroidota bacterium]MBK7639680.1 hypothetical protein [Bacteroidota bacterium]
MGWKTFSGIELNSSLLETIDSTIFDEIQAFGKPRICIGTDSQVKGSLVEFATVILFLRKGRGGFMYVNKELLSLKLNIRERMMKEVNKSIEIAYSLHEILQKYDIKPEIHVDINTSQNHKSNVALQDAMGYIKGMGYDFRAKPDAIASTNCANKVL